MKFVKVFENKSEDTINSNLTNTVAINISELAIIKFKHNHVLSSCLKRLIYFSINFYEYHEKFLGRPILINCLRNRINFYHISHRKILITTRKKFGNLDSSTHFRGVIVGVYTTQFGASGPVHLGFFEKYQ